MLSLNPDRWLEREEDEYNRRYDRYVKWLNSDSYSRWQHNLPPADGLVADDEGNWYDPDELERQLDIAAEEREDFDRYQGD